jgi:ABC-type transport system substrate-binding protein
VGGSAAFLSTACQRGTNTGSGASATATNAQGPLDPTKGVRGGTYVWQGYGDPGGGLSFFRTRNQGVTQLGSLIAEGLLEFRNGTPAYRGTDIQPQPNLAVSMPEISPDNLTFIMKLRPAKFHTGRQVTSEDVKYSFDRYAQDSAWKNDITWYDRTETPDPQTVVVKTKTVYADILQALTGYNYFFVLAKDHEEGSDAENKMVGTGPYLFGEYSPPTSMTYKRNPEYRDPTFPYFDQILRLGTSDITKKVADFESRQVHMTYWFGPEDAQRIQSRRPDAQTWKYLGGQCDRLVIRNDQPPFNDKRVRQALSMAIDRKALSQAVDNGESEADQWLTFGGEYWGFRKPSELPGSKNFEYNVQAAKQLLSAAGVSLPIKIPELTTWDATVVGQKHLDEITLIVAQWKNNGIADATIREMQFGPFASGPAIGNYNGISWMLHPTGSSPLMGSLLRNAFASPATGTSGPPTTNLSYTNIPALTALVEKQLTQLDKNERIQTLRQIEDILSDELPQIPVLSHYQHWFGDPAAKNMQIPREAFNGATPYLKYWWFQSGKAP